MEQFLEQSFNALTLGGIYALIAVGYTMVYGIIKLVNFAHGEIYMIGAFTGVILLGYGIPFWLSLPLAMLFCAVLGALIDWLAYKPLRKSPRLAALITAIGISLILQNIVMLILGAEPRAFPTLNSEFLVWLEIDDTPESPKILQEFTAQLEKKLKAYQAGKFEECSFLKVYQETKKALMRSEKKLEDAKDNEKERAKLLRDYEKRKEQLAKQEQEMPQISHIEILSSLNLIPLQKREKPKISALKLIFRLGTEDNAAIKIFSSAKSEVVEQLRSQYPTHSILDKIDLVPHFFNKVIFPGLTYKSVFILLTTLCLMFCLELIIHRTKLGTAMRACALDKTTAALMGVHVDRIISSTFMIGSALAAVAGVLYGLYLGSGIGYRMGYYAGVIAFASAVLGGIGNIRGAILGGFILGFVQVFANTYFTKWLNISSAYDFAFSFGTLILCILIRPTGILGSISAERA
ncbi:MAG: hypothetical protein AABZ60_01195 [Planctomycetota bacterium]